MSQKLSVIDSRIAPGSTPKPRFLDNLAKRVLLNRLQALTQGEILIRDGDARYQFGQKTAGCPHSVVIHVHSPAFYSDIAFAGSIGAGEAYMAGYWQTSDLTALVQILLCNRDLLDGMEGGLAVITRPLQKVFHWFNRNSQHGSRRNIAAHYDLGNDLFELMLDKSMMYSAAIFDEADMTLHQAQLNRLDRICEKLDLRPTDHLLEIGSGWGGLAIHAASHYGCRVTTTTISREQYQLAQQRIREAGLEDRITLLLEDYRDLDGQYDKLVSIEMIEAVGHQYYDTYFEKCAALLKPQGLMLLQAITIADQRYDEARRSVDFIQRYIFPGSCIPSITALLTSVTASSDMRLLALDDIGLHYATTLRKWRENVFANIHKLRNAGYRQDFIRMWEFYLCYCEGGFLERAISDVHMVLAKPENRHAY